MSTTFAIDARTVNRRFPGIGRYVRNLLHATIPHLRAGERIVYLANEHQQAELALPENARLVWAQTTTSPFSVRQQWQIPQLLRAYRVNVYHSSYYLMPYWAGVPTVLTVYDLIPQLFPEYVSLRARLLFQITTKLAVSRSARVISISEATRRDYIAHSHLEHSQTTTIPLATATHFQPQPAARIQEVNNHYKLPPRYVLYVGANKPHKNLVRLVQAWHEVLQQSEVVHDLVLAGYWDPRYPEVYKEIERLKLGSRVHLLENVADEDLPALYSGASVFVFPSLYEGFGLPVLEAMACGCAVTCANRSSLPEIVGDAALLFDPLRTGEIAKSIQLLLRDDDRRHDYRRKSRKRAAAFSWDRTAAETLQIYREVTRR